MSGTIHQRMTKVMRDVGAIGKDKTNSAQGFKFRGIDQFVNALYPALLANGVYMAPSCTHHEQQLKDVVRGNGKTGVDKHVSILMSYTFHAEDGSSMTVGPIPAEGVDSGDKATNKALSAALKYALIQTFSIPTEDMAEADFESPVLGTPSSSVKDSTPTLSPTDVALYGPPPQGATSDSSAPKKSSFKRPGSSASSTSSTAKPSVVTSASSSSEWE